MPLSSDSDQCETPHAGYHPSSYTIHARGDKTGRDLTRPEYQTILPFAVQIIWEIITERTVKPT